MIGKIDKHGVLWIKRGHEYVETECIDKCFNEVCSHECSHFGEPEKDLMEWMDSEGNKHFMTKLELCEKNLFFREFTDERNS